MIPSLLFEQEQFKIVIQKSHTCNSLMGFTIFPITMGRFFLCSPRSSQCPFRGVCSGFSSFPKHYPLRSPIQQLLTKEKTPYMNQFNRLLNSTTVNIVLFYFPNVHALTLRTITF